MDEGKTILIVTHDPSITELTERTVIISDGELIDENVARALPLLNHRQLMAVTRLIQRSTVQPGAEILPLGDPVAHFFMSRSGEVEVVLQTRRSPELVVARLCQGQFFGEVELVRGWDSIASIRAAEESPVELLSLPHDEFMKMLANSPLTEASHRQDRPGARD